MFTHSFAIAASKLVELGCELLPQPSYSPDLALRAKKWPGEKKTVHIETEAYYFESFKEIYFLDGLKKN